MNKLLPALAAVLVFPNALAQSEPTQPGTPSQVPHDWVPTVEKFLGACKADDDDPHRAFCVGYLTGVAQEMEVIGVQAKGEFRQAHGMCLKEPHGPTGRALTQAFIVWAEKNPRLWSLRYELGAVAALTETWPCPEK
jgi:Ssp1 endopeptidase immunity protein Rap1a